MCSVNWTGILWRNGWRTNRFVSFVKLIQKRESDVKIKRKLKIFSCLQKIQSCRIFFQLRIFPNWKFCGRFWGENNIWSWLFTQKRTWVFIYILIMRKDTNVDWSFSKANEKSINTFKLIIINGWNINETRKQVPNEEMKKN